MDGIFLIQTAKYLRHFQLQQSFPCGFCTAKRLFIRCRRWMTKAGQTGTKMEIVEPKSNNSQNVEEEEDAFLQLVNSARAMLAEAEDSSGESGEELGPAWSWICTHILKTCKAYSSGVTSAILLSELFQAWQEQSRVESSKGKSKNGMMMKMKQKQNQARLHNSVTIDSIYEKKFLSLEGVLEAVIMDIFLLPGTTIYMLSLGDLRSASSINLYLHRKFYDLVEPEYGILRKGREIRLIGCCLRSSTTMGSNQLRLLPTEYLVILLDEEQDEDAMLLGAQFCSDTFSSISLDAVEAGRGYCFYARVEKIGGVEFQGQSGHLKRQQISLVDTEGSNLEFVLWDEQILLANLFSEGSMIALDRPFIARDFDCGIKATRGICLEYGSATRLYSVPYVHLEEQVIVGSSQIWNQLSRPLSMSNHSLCEAESQGYRISQVMLPCDSQGLVDFSNFPFRLFVADLKKKMTNVSLYGVVTSLGRICNGIGNPFLVKIQDCTGSVSVKLHFGSSWTTEKICCGDTIFLSGLTCSMSTESRFECSWHENNDKASLVNISHLPALLNSTCLCHISSLSQLSIHTSATQVCRVLIERVELHHLSIVQSHSQCGHSVKKESNGSFVCSLCLCIGYEEVIHNFSFTINLVDATAKVSASCSGQSAAELLQVSPDEFCAWPEDEQVMYLYTIQNDEFMVAICKQIFNNDDSGEAGNRDTVSTVTPWRIARALKCD